MDFKNLRAGYQGKADAMREMADRLANHPGHAPDIIFSKTAADKEKMRPYKEGGRVSTNEDEVKNKKSMLSSRTHIERMKNDISEKDLKKAAIKRHNINLAKALTGGHVLGASRIEHLNKPEVKIKVEKALTGGVGRPQFDNLKREGKTEKRLISGSSNLNLEKTFKGGGMGPHKDEYEEYDKPAKFAEGGIGKFRHGQSTLSGKQIAKKKNPVKNTY